jgi:hypothetical protein
LIEKGEEDMQNQIPHFKINTVRNIDKQLGYIDANGVVLHWVKDLAEFYSALGYTHSMAKAGVLPDEFIWDEYIKDGAASSTACMQMHIIEYLSKHSEGFREKYGDQYKSWIATYKDAIKEDDEMCLSCSVMRFCS